MKPRVPPLLRPAQRFRATQTEPVAEDYECEHCGEYLDPDGLCPECDDDGSE